MGKSSVRVKTKVKVTNAAKGKSPVKPKFSSGKGGFLTEKIAVTVNSKKK